MLRLISSTPRLISTKTPQPKMPAFTLYGALGSTNTDRVRLTLAEGGFDDFEFANLVFQNRDQKVSKLRCYRLFVFCSLATFADALSQSEAHMKRHPWGKVPALTLANGFTLYESRAICQFLAKKYSFPLVPSSDDLEATALFDQALSVEMLYFADPAGKIGFEKFAKKFVGLPTDEAVVAASAKALESFFDVMDGLLGERKWMAGNEFTLVDIYYVPLIRRLFVCGFEDSVFQRKNVAAWWERAIARPGIAKQLAADEERAAAARK